MYFLESSHIQLEFGLKWDSIRSTIQFCSTSNFQFDASIRYKVTEKADDRNGVGG